MAKASVMKRLLVWRYRHISGKNFIYLLSLVIGLLAGLTSVILKNVTFAIESIFAKVLIFSNYQLYFILPFLGLFLVYLFVKYISKTPGEHAIPTIYIPYLNATAYWTSDIFIYLL